MVFGFAIDMSGRKKMKKQNEKNLYATRRIAKDYEFNRLKDNFGKYQHHCEVKAIFNFLERPPRNNQKIKILEVGCGTGRITEELVKKKYDVLAIDNSQLMLNQYLQKKDLPKPKFADATKLPFKNGEFSYILAIRVIWHLLKKKDRENMIKECSRVSSNYIILDIANKNRLENPIFKFLVRIYFKLFPRKFPIPKKDYYYSLEQFEILCKKNNLKIIKKTPLNSLTPVWVNFLPYKIARGLFPILRFFDILFASIVPPYRYMVKLKKIKN